MLRKKHYTLSSKTYSRPLISLFSPLVQLLSTVIVDEVPSATSFFYVSDVCHFFVMYFHIGESLFTFSCLIHSRLSFT